MRITDAWFFRVLMVLILPLMVLGALAQTAPDARSITVYQEAG